MLSCKFLLSLEAFLGGVTLYYDSLGPMDCSHQAPLSMKFLRQEYWSGLGLVEWVVITSSRGSSRPRDHTRISYVSCIGRQVLYHQHHLGSASLYSFLPPRHRDSLRKKHLKCVQLSPVSCMGARLLLPVGEHSHGCDGNTLPTFMNTFSCTSITL